MRYICEDVSLARGVLLDEWSEVGARAYFAHTIAYPADVFIGPDTYIRCQDSVFVALDAGTAWCARLKSGRGSSGGPQGCLVPGSVHGS